MSVLKALQKKQAEETQPQPEREKVSKVMPFEKRERRTYDAPEGFLDQGFKIGAPVSAPEIVIENESTNVTPITAFDGQSDSNVGMALPNKKTDITAGATLNAVGSTRITVEKTFPEFTSWKVEAERVEPRLVAITQPHSNYCEEYRSLRTHVLHKSQKQKLQSIVVASVGPAEGKSVTALNLSWMLAQTDGVKALIIDSDLRMPSLTDYLGIETETGLSEILAGKVSLKDAIVRLEPSGLHLLPGGEARSDVAELISGPKFKEILREAREMFDYVIIDAPPLGIFTDATVLINHADGALLVVRANRTRYNQVDRILESLPRDRMMGVILNQSEDVMSESHYNYGYYNRRRD